MEFVERKQEICRYTSCFNKTRVSVLEYVCIRERPLPSAEYISQGLIQKSQHVSFPAVTRGRFDTLHIKPGITEQFAVRLLHLPIPIPSYIHTFLLVPALRFIGVDPPLPEPASSFDRILSLLVTSRKQPRSQRSDNCDGEEFSEIFHGKGDCVDSWNSIQWDHHLYGNQTPKRMDERSRRFGLLWEEAAATGKYRPRFLVPPCNTTCTHHESANQNLCIYSRGVLESFRLLD